MSVVYALCDPDSQEIRYIGKTEKDLRRRFRDHISYARRGCQTHRARWIRSLGSIEPLLVVLEVDPPGGAAEAERSWIATARRYGARLTNLTDGGDGAVGFRHTDESREKIRLALAGKRKSEQHRAALSVARKGRRASLEERERMSARRRGVPHTAERRAAISTGLKGHPVSDETRRKISLAALERAARRRACSTSS